MSCTRIQKKLPLAVGGDLDAESLERVTTHVRGCLTCYRVYRSYRDSLNALGPFRAPSAPSAPPGLFEAIMRDVEERVEGPRAPHPTPLWARSSRLARYTIPFAAGFVVVASVGLHVFDRRTNERPVAPSRDETSAPFVFVNRNGSGSGPADRIDSSDSFVIPPVLRSGRLRPIGPASLRRSEPFPPAALRTISQDDF